MTRDIQTGTDHSPLTTLDWEWAKASGGNLTPGEGRKLLRPLLRSVPRLAAERSRAALGRRGSASIDLAGLTWPDTRLAREAETEARGTLSPHMLEHSYRSYLFGLVLCQIDGVTPNEELAFTACLLHDIQLGVPTAGRCFAVVGGERAYRFALDHGGDEQTARTVGAAIAGHITPGVADDLSDLAGFVSAGALVDVAGARLQEMDRIWVSDVVRRHPRRDFKRQLRVAMNSEIAAVPNGRAAWLFRWARFGLLIDAAPFAE